MDTPAPGSPRYIPADKARKNFYGQLTVPTGYVDGTYSDYQQWSDEIQQEILETAPISIIIVGSIYPGTTTHILAFVHGESAMTGSSHHIYIAVTEDNLAYFSYLKGINRVVRYINGDGNGESFTIAPGEDKTYSVEVTIPPQWVWQNLWAECWVQDWDGKPPCGECPGDSIYKFWLDT